MRVAILSDIHANLEALEAVVSHLEARAPDVVVCLGDFVGYGPDPNECIDRVRPRLRGAVIGNHDHAALGHRSIDDFNLFAQEAILWTQHQLTEASRAYLESLPVRDDTAVTGVVLVHGSLRQPVEEYVLDARTARGSFAADGFRIAAVGHTHQPVVFEESGGRVRTRRFVPGVPLALAAGSRYIINAGSVGQPRDGDPRAAYAILDLAAASVTAFRLPYAFEATQRKMEAAGLPVPLIERLAVGH